MGMSKSVWIGVPSGTGEKFGNYFRAVRAAGGVPFSPNMDGDDFSCRVPDAAARPGTAAQGGVIRPADCAALLLPGGGDLNPSLYGQPNTASRNLEPERDALEQNLLEQFLLEKKPVLGICRGMQCLSVYLGGTIVQDIPGHSAVDGLAGRTDRLHTVRTAPGPFFEIFRAAGLLSGAGEELTVNSSHHQAVDRPGAGLDVVQRAGDGIAEAVRHRSLPVWGVQWHPERLAGEAGAALFRGFLGLCQ